MSRWREWSDCRPAIATATRPFSKLDFVFGVGNRWANRHTGSIDLYTKGRKFIHVDIEPTQIGRVFGPDFGIVSDARAALKLFIEAARALKAEGKLKDRSEWAGRCLHRKKSMLRRSHFDQVPLKPQRVYQEMNECLDRDTCYVTTIGLSQIAGAQFLHVYGPRNWINCGQAGPLGWTLPAALGVRAADPKRKIVALSGDYDFQFMIEELAVGAQHKLPYLHVVVNNSYLGLIRQSQRGFEMDFEVFSRLREHQRRAQGRCGARLWRGPRGGRGGPRLQSHPRQEPKRIQGCLRPRPRAHGGTPGSRRARVHPRARHQHLDGDRGRGCERIRGNPLPGPEAIDQEEVRTCGPRRRNPLSWTSADPSTPRRRSSL